MVTGESLGGGKGNHRLFLDALAGSNQGQKAGEETQTHL